MKSNGVNMINNTSFDKRKYEVKGALTALLKQLNALPADPARPAQKGPHFLYKNDNIKLAGDHDGMWGEMLLQHFMSAALPAGVSNDNGLPGAMAAVGADDIADIVSDYLEDRCEQEKRGKGTYGLGEHKTICNMFNNAPCDAENAYKASLPLRMQIEKSLAAYARELETLQLAA